MDLNVLLLPGDGIGAEVIREARRVLEAVAARFGHRLQAADGLIGGAAIRATGTPLPPETETRAREADATLLGAVGLPEFDTAPPDRRPERGLLALRQALGVYANLRPVRAFPALAAASPLKRDRVEGTDLLIVRELTAGLYYGTPRGIEGEGREARAVNTMCYTRGEIERVARLAFELARGRRGQVTSVDKSNVLENSQLWRQVVNEVSRDFPDVRLDHLLVDNCAMQLILRPSRFDVVLTENMFGDILSDEAAMLTGSIGMLPSASLGEEGPGVFEPVHGSAPDIAGSGAANPLAMFLSAALMLRHGFALEAQAAAVESAVDRALAEGLRTADLGGQAGTAEATRAVLDHL
jgi:3-isopropylmalate dehydrogenase